MDGCGHLLPTHLPCHLFYITYLPYAPVSVLPLYTPAYFPAHLPAYLSATHGGVYRDNSPSLEHASQKKKNDWFGRWKYKKQSFPWAGRGTRGAQRRVRQPRPDQAADCAGDAFPENLIV